ncbi:hypothetical protein [Klebsiella quasipneumoniae]|uniref:hypothetical protein n=1 Tax=Klebsiella quasipneumoniae TaxID=1463165 RepID=UPI00114E8988|nr:hypothetical protein [Klebsiella quasipneumoniae]
MKYLVLFCFLISTQIVRASDKNDEIFSSESDFGSLLDLDANERYHDQFIDFKKSQNNLTDSERTKMFFKINTG